MPDAGHPLHPPPPLILPAPAQRPPDTRWWHRSLGGLFAAVMLAGVLIAIYSVVQLVGSHSGWAVLGWLLLAMFGLILGNAGTPMGHQFGRVSNLNSAFLTWEAGTTAYTELQRALPKGWQVARLEARCAAVVGPATRHLLFLDEVQHTERTQSVLDQGDVRVHSWIPSAGQALVQLGGVQLGGDVAAVAEQLVYWDDVVGRDRARRQAGVDAERQAVEALQRTAPPGWRVQAGLLMTGGGDIDALLTGPDGARWVVEVKSHRGAPSLIGGTLHFGQDEKGDVWTQVRRQAREADARPIVWQPLADHAPWNREGVTFLAGADPATLWSVVAVGHRP